MSVKCFFSAPDVRFRILFDTNFNGRFLNPTFLFDVPRPASCLLVLGPLGLELHAPRLLVGDLDLLPLLDLDETVVDSPAVTLLHRVRWRVRGHRAAGTRPGQPSKSPHVSVKLRAWSVLSKMLEA